MPNRAWRHTKLVITSICISNYVEHPRRSAHVAVFHVRWTGRGRMSHPCEHLVEKHEHRTHFADQVILWNVISWRYEDNMRLTMNGISKNRRSLLDLNPPRSVRLCLPEIEDRSHLIMMTNVAMKTDTTSSSSHEQSKQQCKQIMNYSEILWKYEIPLQRYAISRNNFMTIHAICTKNDGCCRERFQNETQKQT